MFKRNFQITLYLSCCFVITLAMSACAFLFYQYNSRLMINNIKNNTASTLDLLDMQLNNVLSDMNSSLKTIQTSENFLNIIQQIPYSDANYFASQPSQSSNMKNIFRTILYSKSSDRSLHYVNTYLDNVGTSVSNSSAYFGKVKLHSNDNIMQLLASNNYEAYLLPHQDYWTNKDNQVISVVRWVRSAFQSYGILEYTIQMSEIDKLITLSSYNQTGEYSFMILDENNNFIYRSDNSLDTQTLLNIYKKNDTDATHNTFFVNESYIASEKTFSLTNWKLIMIHNVSDLTKQIHNLVRLTILAFFIILIVVALFLYFLIRYLTKPLRSLCDQLLTCELSPDVRISVATESNEIITLTNTIQDILSQIYIQNNKLVEIRKRTLRAHYDAMEAQLNPHFLYNTLAVIGASALNDGNITVSKMCSELAKLLRYTISYSGKSVPLKSEINNIQSYLYIMKARHEDALECTWELDESINDIHVPKLILQPLVENCFQHGFQDTAPPWKIKIKSYQLDGNWYVSVSNNGTPFSNEKKELLFQRFEQSKNSFFEECDSVEFQEKQGFGLENTVIRLHIYYSGNEYFQITSQNQWTKITIGSIINEQQN